MKRICAALMGMILSTVLAGCTGTTQTTPLAGHRDDAQVVTRQGLGEVRFGDSHAKLARDHGLTQGPGDCAPRLPAHRAVSPVLDGDQLVLLWAEPPMRTPEGVGVGTPVEQLYRTYPDADQLSAPPDSYQFDGLLAGDAERAYLFLHDETAVRKLIVGSTEHARLLFEEGFGTC